MICHHTVKAMNGHLSVTETKMIGVVYPTALIPDLQETIPGACSHSHPIVGYSQAADAIIMTRQNPCEHKDKPEVASR